MNNNDFKDLLSSKPESFSVSSIQKPAIPTKGHSRQPKPPKKSQPKQERRKPSHVVENNYRDRAGERRVKGEDGEAQDGSSTAAADPPITKGLDFALLRRMKAKSSENGISSTTLGKNSGIQGSDPLLSSSLPSSTPTLVASEPLSSLGRKLAALLPELTVRGRQMSTKKSSLVSDPAYMLASTCFMFGEATTLPTRVSTSSQSFPHKDSRRFICNSLARGLLEQLAVACDGSSGPLEGQDGAKMTAVTSLRPPQVDMGTTSYGDDGVDAGESMMIDDIYGEDLGDDYDPFSSSTHSDPAPTPRQQAGTSNPNPGTSCFGPPPHVRANVDADSDTPASSSDLLAPVSAVLAQARARQARRQDGPQGVASTGQCETSLGMLGALTAGDADDDVRLGSRWDSDSDSNGGGGGEDDDDDGAPRRKKRR